MSNKDYKILLFK